MTINATNNTSISEVQLRDSLSVVTRASDPRGQRELTDLSRINEQDMFAALVHRQLKNKEPALAEKFEQRFATLVFEQAEKNPGHAVFEAARMALRRMRLAGDISRDVAVKIRHFALGKAQLDSKREELSTRNVTGKAGDTALRAVKTAITLFTGNAVASTEEMTLFRDLNSNRRAQTRVE